MGPRAATTLLLWGLVIAAEGRSLAKEEDKDGDVGTLYFYDQRQNGTYNIQIHLKDVEVLALLASDSEDYDDSYDEYEYHDPVETPYNPTLTPPPEPNSTAAANATSAAEPCDTPSTTASTTASTTTSTTTTTTAATTTTTTTKAASARRRCRPGYTRREGGGCKRTASGGRPLLALPFGLRMAQRHADHVRDHVRDRANFKPPRLD